MSRRRAPIEQALAPDPACGVFSTMLVVAGEPVALDAHLARLRASARALYRMELPASAAELVAREARRVELGRVRLAVRTDASGPARLEAVASAIDRALVLPERGLDLRSATVEGWHGAHKWVDRRLLDRLDAAAAPDGALLVTPDGRVLETTRANVFALGEDGILRTPPTDGSILPGVVRAAALALAEERGVAVREEPLTRAQLHAAREAFTTGSVRGVEPVRSLDGIPVGGRARDGRGELAEAIADALHRRWRLHERM